MPNLGIHSFLADADRYKNVRAGLVVHAASFAEVEEEFQHSIQLIQHHADVRLVRLFAPEHGLYGQGAAGELLPDVTDTNSGLQVVSLYGERRAPDPEHLSNLDILIFDLGDVGVRCFTYLATLKACLERCAQTETKLIVLGRPNPLGRKVFGEGVKDGFESFVSPLDIPFVHGQTLAELAQVMAKSLNAQDWLECYFVTNWSGERWPGTGLPWFKPSPNLPSFKAAFLYPATVFLEGTSLSEGRGTAFPFEQFGAPWLKAEKVAQALCNETITATPTSFLPTTSKYEGDVCRGVYLTVTSTEHFNPLFTAEKILDLIALTSPENLEFLRGKDGRYFIDLLYGSSELRRRVAGKYT